MKNLFKVLIAVFVLITGFSCARVDRTSHKGGNNEENGAVRARQQEKTDDFVSADAPDENATSPIVHYGPKPIQTLHVFIENSGSMNGYINVASDFQTAIGTAIQYMKYQYSSEKINVYYINQKIYEQDIPQGISLTELYSFIQKMLQRGEFTTSGTHHHSSSTAATDLNMIIKEILGYVDENNTAILISDCIYSLPSTKGDIKKLLNDCKILTNGAFLEKTRELPMGISLATNFIQFSSNFAGKYWTWEHPTGNQYVTLQCRRPYYMCVIGTDENVNNFNSKIGISDLDGFQNQFTISNKDVSNANYSVLNSKYKVGTFRPYGSMCIREITKVKANTVGKFELGIGMDLDGFSMSETDKTDANNYSIDAGNYSIVRIERIDTTKLTNATDKILIRENHLTHAIVLACTSYPNDIKISIKRCMPQWVANSSSIDDRNIGKDIEEQTKTFGLKYFVDGISEAYKYIANDKNNFMTIHVRVKSN